MNITSKEELMKSIFESDLLVFSQNPACPYFIRPVVDGEFKFQDQEKKFVLVAWNGDFSDLVTKRIQITEDEKKYYSDFKHIDLEKFFALIKNGEYTIYIEIRKKDREGI